MNPNNPYDSEVLEWVNRYLQNDFDPEMEIALAERSLKDPGIVKCLLDNLDMDRLIRCWQRRNCPGPFPVYHAKHREGSDEDSLLIGDFLPVSFDQFDPELNTTIVRQDPVDFEVLQPSFRTDLKKILRALWSKNTLKYLTPILLLFGAMIWGLWGILHCNDPDSLHEYAPIARVADLIDPVWAEGEETFKPGQEFGPNKLFLRSGWARIQFLNGNEVILKGNTDLIVNDEKSLFCNQGDLAVTVSSQGKDLEIITPFARVIDRGTRFSLSVSKENTQVDVFKGKVDVGWSAKGTFFNLLEGDGADIPKDLEPRKRAADSGRSLWGSRYQKLLEDYFIRQTRQRNRYREKIDQDPSLLARYDFNTPISSGSIENRALRNNTQIKSATVVNGSSGQGRFPEWRSAALRNANSRIDLDVPGALNAMTLYFSFQLESLPKSGTVLFLSEDQENQPGAIAVQIIQGGRFQLRIRRPNDTVYDHYISDPVISRLNQKTWISFAITFDVKTGIQFVLDGKVIKTFPLENRIPIVIGKAAIGNPGNKITATKRTFRGYLDETALWNRVLSVEEIRDMNKSTTNEIADTGNKEINTQQTGVLR